LTAKSLTLSRNANPPVIAARNKRVDQYIPRFRDALLLTFDHYSSLAARRAKFGIRDIYTPEMHGDLLKELYDTETKFVYAIIVDGYTFANDELGFKSFDNDMWKKDGIPNPVTGRKTQIEEYLQATAKREANTHADMINKEFQKARNYWDEEKKRGLTPKEISKEILRKGYALDKNYANLISRTTSIWSMNEGAEIRYLEAGITKEEWLTDEDDLTCDYCAQMNGQIVGIKDEFLPEGVKLEHTKIEGRFLSVPFAVGHPPLHPHCLVGETSVLSSDNRAAFIASYAGVIVHLTTVDGRRISVSENHVFPTINGFARAKGMRSGDYMFDCTGLQRVLAGDVNENWTPSRIDNIVKTFASTAQSSKTIASATDFHGDGSFMNSKIDIISTNSFLSGDSKPTSYEQAIRDILIDGRVQDHTFNGLGMFNTMLLRMACTFDGSMSGDGVLGVFLRGSLTHHKPISLDLASNVDMAFSQITPDDITTNIEMIGQEVFGLPGLITPIKISSVEFDFSHLESPIKVYDLQTNTSLYIANGFLSSNCRCTIIPVIENFSIRAE